MLERRIADGRTEWPEYEASDTEQSLAGCAGRQGRIELDEEGLQLWPTFQSGETVAVCGEVVVQLFWDCHAAFLSGEEQVVIIVTLWRAVTGQSSRWWVVHLGQPFPDVLES